MTVVSAGVHYAGPLGGVGDVAVLLHRERVHIGPKSNRLSTDTALQKSDDARIGGSPGYYALFPQIRLYLFRRLELFSAQFRKLMDISSQTYDLVLYCLRFSQKIQRHLNITPSYTYTLGTLAVNETGTVPVIDDVFFANSSIVMVSSPCRPISTTSSPGAASFTCDVPTTH